MQAKRELQKGLLLDQIKPFLTVFHKYNGSDNLFSFGTFSITQASFYFYFLTLLGSNNKSSRSQMFFKQGVLINFAIFTRKHHLCWSLFLIKLQAWRPVTLLKRLQNKGFSMNILKFLRTVFLRPASGICQSKHWKLLHKNNRKLIWNVHNITKIFKVLKMFIQLTFWEFWKIW